jgi:hypothetical protein
MDDDGVLHPPKAIWLAATSRGLGCSYYLRPMGVPLACPFLCSPGVHDCRGDFARVYRHRKSDKSSPARGEV